MSRQSTPQPQGGVSTSPLDWFPLATEQLRLRSLTEVTVYHPTCQGPHSDSIRFHLTFHESPLSPPFYTSVRSKPLDNRVSWLDLEHKMEEFGGARAVIIRLWRNMMDDEGRITSDSLSIWGVTFSGLVCVGDKISRKISSQMSENSFVFKLHQYYFVSNQSLEDPLVQARFLEVPFIAFDSCKSSYDKGTLTKLAATLRALKQIEISNGRVKKEISGRLEPGMAVPTHGSLASTASLRQQIFSVQPKLQSTKMAEINLAVKIENIKFRLALLKQEKERLTSEVNAKKDLKDKSLSDGDEVNSHLLENYHTLSKDKDKLESWLSSFQESRECNQRTKTGLRIRRNQLISQLREIFPIHGADSPQPTICHVVVPSSENMKDRDDTDLSVGLGWVSHLTTMVGNLLSVPLRYPTLSAGSRSSISDFILEKLPDKEREFPLFARGVERVKFEYGVYLLNKNISQLRWSCDIQTYDLRPTLANLSGLLDTCTAGADTCLEDGGTCQSSPARHQLPIAPPVLAGVTRMSSLSSSPGRKHYDSSPSRRHRDKLVTTSSEQDLEEEVVSICVKESNSLDNVEHHENSSKSEENEEVQEIDVTENICDDQSDIKISPVTSLTNFPSPGSDYCLTTANGVCTEEEEDGAGDQIEEAVEAAHAEMFWDSVTNRTEALSVPNTFKRQLGRNY